MKITRTRILLAIPAVALLTGCGKKENTPPPAPPAATATADVAPEPATNPAFTVLAGKWLRPDGGYVLDIRSVTHDGKMDAGYFNPNPIHVAKAVASRDGASLKVFVELRDVNYPGSSYTLVHDPASDQLKGVYFQAIQQQSFDVFFTRTPR